MSTVTTYLDFGMTKAGKRTAYDYREGQIAYDLFMGARYLNDLIAYRHGRVDEVYHPEDVRDTLRKYTALSVCAGSSPRLTYYEVGSSVMGVIDALEYLNTEYRELETRHITWHGVDNSSFMNSMAQYTHDGHDIRLSTTVDAIPCDLCFAKGVSLLYAIDTEALLCDVLSSCRIAIFDYTFARAGTISEVVGTGLPVTFLNLEACRRGLTIDGKMLVLEPYTIKTYHQSPNKVTYDCVYGDTAVVERYLEAVEQKSAAFERVWQRPLIRPARCQAVLT
jgi:hypothetical protein